MIALDADRAIVLLGDIEGKGVEAAAAVGLVRQTLKTTIALEPDPEVVFKQLNEAVNTHDSHSRMCTLAYVSLVRRHDGFSGTVALAGHPPPVLIRRDGSVEFLGEVVPPAGLFDDLAPLPQSFELGQGDLVVLYTDGLAGPGLTAPETIEGLIPQVETTEPEPFLAAILERFSEEVPAPRDDIAILAFRVTV